MATNLPDPSVYVRAPVMTLAGGITLCRVVANACPATMPDFVKKSATHLAAVAEDAQKAFVARKKALGQSNDDAQNIDKWADRSWSALRGRLEMVTLLPPEVYPGAKRAKEILELLFDETGLSFLTQRYPEQYTIAGTYLRRIDEENLAVDIDHLAGADFLANVRLQHNAYGSMVARMLERENALGDDLSEHVRAMGQTLVEYATKVLASIDRDDSTTIQAATAALRPIDVFRENTQARQTKPNEPDLAPAPEDSPAQG
jgi:hypothetical protein